MMSEEQQAQADKNTRDIRTFKVGLPIMWFCGVLFTFGGFVWVIATYSANKTNTEVTYKADQSRQSDDLKKYLLIVIQQFRTKDSTDIANYHSDLANAIYTHQITTDDEIRLLREQCKRVINLSYGEHFHYDENGKRIVTAEENR